MAGVLWVSAAAQPPGPERFNVVIGFSARVLGKANRNDLTAAMKAWMHTLVTERHLAADAHLEVFNSVDALALALRQERVDVASVSVDDFIVLERMVPLAGMFSVRTNGKPSDQYVVLVRRYRAWKGLAELRGEASVILDKPRTLMAPVWLDTELLRRRLPVAARFFSKVTYAEKPNLAIMPLFFKRAGVVLMTRAGFETACELNPQLGKELAVLMTSQELLSSVGAYRANATSSSVAMYRREALRLGETAAGKLILNLFQTEAIVELKESDLRATRALLAEHAKLLAGAQRKAGAP